MRLYLLTAALLAAPCIAAQPNGEAQQLSAEVDWFNELTKGGMTGVALFLLGFTAVTMVVERVMRLRAARLIPPDFVRRANPLWSEGRFDELATLCRQNPSALARMALFVVEHRQAPPDLLIQGAADIGAREIAGEQKRTYGLAVIAGLAPLLGLLGTIIGMIESFKLVEMYGDDGGATVLAGSISKALITTALGLVIAIPSLALFHLFKYKIQALNTLLDEQMEILVNAWLLKGMPVANPGPAMGVRDASSQVMRADGGPMTFYCSACRQKLQADADMAGSVITCPRCAASITIPAVSTD